MISDQWQKAKDLFNAALKCSPDERLRFVDENCDGDEAVRREVESLLANSEDAAVFLEKPAVGEVAEAIAGNNEKLRASQSLSHYKILKLLGEGGMGEVYLAEDTQLNRKIALKLLAAHITEDKNRVSRFRQEAFATSALNHPNILTIYEIGNWQNRDFIATEFIDGMTLRSLLQKKKLSIGEILDIALQTASALSAAHGAGIVHRDIKPENVMIRPDGLVKVLDFGIAKYRPTAGGRKALVQTEVGEVIGTAAYMSPEQARGLEIDAQTDIWSLGVILYEMIARKLPFPGKTKSDRIAAILEHEPAPLAEINRKVPPQFQQIINRALAKNKKERYANMAEMAEDLHLLRAAMGDKSSSSFILPARKSVASRRARLFAVFASIVLLVGAVGLGYWFLANRTAGKKQIESIAVMPFVNESGDANVEYLSDGMTETLISSLSQIPNLNVKARSSVFRYKGKETDAATIGKQLNVQAIVHGTVVQRGQDLALHVELVDAQTENALWSADYKQPMTNLVSLQSEIARDVSQKLKIKLSGADEQKVEKNYTENAEAYQFYLRGRYFWNKRNTEGIKKAIEQFQQAIDSDPNYALGYVGLADSYIFLAEFGDATESEMFPKARAAADRALQLDDSLAEAHASSALLYRNLWRWAEAEEEFKRAVSLNPNYSAVHIWFSVYFRNKRQFDDALREIKRAQELDPLSPVIGANVAYVYVLNNDPNSAVEQCKRTIELDPNIPLTHELLGIAYLKQQRYEEATVEFENAVELSKRASSRYLSSLGYCYAITGRHSEALAILKELEKPYAVGEANGQSLAGVYAGLGDKEQAFAWLEKDFERRSLALPEITWRFAFENLRDDPRYADLVRRIGLPQ